MATQISNNPAITAMQEMMQRRIEAEPDFALKMAAPNKSLEKAINHLCRVVQKSGLCVLTNEAVEAILVDYFDEPNVEEGAPINCNIVVSKPELSEEDKAELQEQAREQFKEEEMKRLRNEARAKGIDTNPKPTAHKATSSDNQPNLFDF